MVAAHVAAMVGMQTAGQAEVRGRLLGGIQGFSAANSDDNVGFEILRLCFDLGNIGGAGFTGKQVLAPGDTTFIERFYERFFRRCQGVLTSADQRAIAPRGDAVSGLTENAGTVRVLSGSRTDKVERGGAWPLFSIRFSG